MRAGLLLLALAGCGTAAGPVDALVVPPAPLPASSERAAADPAPIPDLEPGERECGRPNDALVLALDRALDPASSRVAAAAVLDRLAGHDLLAVVSFETEPVRVVKFQRAENRVRIGAALDELRSGPPGDLFAALDSVLEDLSLVAATRKHAVVVSTSPANAYGIPELTAELVRSRIRVSTVAVGSRADAPLLDRIARVTGGRFHRVDVASQVPAIVVREVELATPPL